MKEKEDQLIIRSSKESIYMCVCGCCMLVFLAFLCKGDGLFVVRLMAVLVLLRMTMVSNETLILQPSGLTVKRGKKGKTYNWDEFHTKIVVKAKGNVDAANILIFLNINTYGDRHCQRYFIN